MFLECGFSYMNVLMRSRRDIWNKKQQNSEKNLLSKFHHLLALIFGSSSVDACKNSVWSTLSCNRQGSWALKQDILSWTSLNLIVRFREERGRWCEAAGWQRWGSRRHALEIVKYQSPVILPWYLWMKLEGLNNSLKFHFTCWTIWVVKVSLAIFKWRFWNRGPDCAILDQGKRKFLLKSQGFCFQALQNTEAVGGLVRWLHLCVGRSLPGTEFYRNFRAFFYFIGVWLEYARAEKQGVNWSCM